MQERVLRNGNAGGSWILSTELVELELELEDTGVSMAGRGRGNKKWSFPMSSETGGEISWEADPGRMKLQGGLGIVALLSTVNTNHPNVQGEWKLPEQAPQQNGAFPLIPCSFLVSAENGKWVRGQKLNSRNSQDVLRIGSTK